MVHHLCKVNSIANHFMAELRDIDIQKDSMRFRTNLQRLGTLMAYEISKTLSYKETEVTTPLGTSKVALLAQQPVLCTVLRASLPMYNGFLDVFDKSQTAFIGAFRGSHNPGDDIKIELNYLASPALDGATFILIDPMLATGKSIVKTVKALEGHGKISRLIVAAAIAAQQGVDYVNAELPNADIWCAAIDPHLNDSSYIVPGLGDAGDLCFGEKL